jgi:hypothetical protein
MVSIFDLLQGQVERLMCKIFKYEEKCFIFLKMKKST